jgi:hypothetical protein
MVNEMFDPIDIQERERSLEQRRSLLAPEPGVRWATEEARTFSLAAGELSESQANRIAQIEAQESLSSRYRTDFDIQERENLLERRRVLISPEFGLRRVGEEASTFGSAARGLMEGQASRIARVEAQESHSSRYQTNYFRDFPGLGEAFRQTRYELAQASEFVRAHAAVTEHLREIERFRGPQFEFPTVPSWMTPGWHQTQLVMPKKSHVKGAMVLADRGWTIPAWISMRDIQTLGKSSDNETDEFFLKRYLGKHGEEGEFKDTSEKLLASDEMRRWRSLLQDIFYCIQTGKYKVCVPSLLTVLEGFIAEFLAKEPNTSRRNPNIAASLKKRKMHEDESFDGLLWMSVVTFLDHLFAYSDFESACPTFINRHWILHGRSATEWTVTDALKLVNALSTLRWLST